MIVLTSHQRKPPSKEADGLVAAEKQIPSRSALQTLMNAHLCCEEQITSGSLNIQYIGEFQD